MKAIHPIAPLNQAMPKAHSAAPIGIFDSGIGGSSIAIEIARYLPNEQILYYADTANVPYGPRDDQDIRELTAHAIEWLYRQGCKIAVVACNTASAFSLEYLRAHYGDDFPIIGLVPALKPAVLQTKTKTVAVLATPATFRGQLIQDVMQRFAQPLHVNVLQIACLDLVPFVEAGQQMQPQCLQTLSDILQPALDQHADYLVLGCTHYPFLKPAIESLFAKQLTLIDSGVAVARQTARILSKNKLLFEHRRPVGVQIHCYLSGNNADHLYPVLARMIPNDISWRVTNLQDQVI
ncbi:MULTISPECIES: glutamate racemase [unclassified Acinetobacter]|uniref:glutamate racemase n=1 Tax=unclassified Acinetobacter TaxID=196816 RepID=UPI002935276C|nr:MULTISPECIES: glutamate racemase [unclassified Acinetobacter]WOE30582.1 glutamate racemase [Acinetobacter sp. SAAs470]WOE38774.1 glutamate racemase [Acinetobacter sp. SAAs474]